MTEIQSRYPHLAELPPTLHDSVGGTPPRRPGSVRRTSTIDMVWPGGHGTALHLVGRARDLLTSGDGEACVLGEASMRAAVAEGRRIESIEVSPERPGVQGLVGAVGGSALRGAIDEALPGEREAATSLHLLLDDIAGTSLIAGFAWSRSRADVRARMSGAGSDSFGLRKGRIICSGLRPEGWADTHRKEGAYPGHALVPAADFANAEDPLAWHELLPAPEVGMRRHRRVDVWQSGGLFQVDAFFRDACWDPDGSQHALHEYTVAAQVDPEKLTLVSVVATPRVLPFPECQWAAPHVDLLTGLPVANFRTRVQETLVERKACTHLNDMLRCVAEVPALVAAL